MVSVAAHARTTDRIQGFVPTRLAGAEQARPRRARGQAQTATAAEGGGAAAARVAAWPVGSADGAGRPLPAGDAASHEGAEGW